MTLRLPPNVTQKSPTRVCARVSVGGTRRRKYFPIDPETRRTGCLSMPLRARIEQWITRTEQELGDAREAYGDPPLVGHRPPSGSALTLDLAWPRHIARIKSRKSWDSDQSHLRTVCETEIDVHDTGRLVRVGSLPLDAITPDIVKLLVSAWAQAPSAQAVRRVRVAAYERNGVTMPAYERDKPVTSANLAAPRTVRHRLRVLRECCATFDVPNPTAGVTRPRVPRPVPVAVSEDTIIAVARRLAQATRPRTRVRPPRDPEAYAQREAKRQREALLTYVRYLVLVTTGQRPVQVGLAQRDDVDLDVGRTWFVRECKFAPPHTINLTTPMQQAWQLFIEANAWGAFDTTTHGNRVHAAGWPAPIRPYNARHSLMIQARNQYDVDRGDVKDLAGHTQQSTTDMFYLSTDAQKMRQISAKLERRLAGLFSGLRKVK